MTLTPAQQKALDWLPSDGNWRIRPSKPILAELLYIDIFYPGLIDAELGKSTIGTTDVFYYRLTPKGIAYKAGREG